MIYESKTNEIDIKLTKRVHICNCLVGLIVMNRTVTLNPGENNGQMTMEYHGSPW